jgi:uncharacterized protein (TIGR03067 family)
MSAAVLIIFLAVDTDDPAIRKEIERLDGTWKVVAVEADGKKVAEKDIPFERVMFKQGKLDAEKERKKGAAALTYKLVLSKNPKAISVHDDRFIHCPPVSE